MVSVVAGGARFGALRRKIAGSGARANLGDAPSEQRVVTDAHVEVARRPATELAAPMP